MHDFDGVAGLVPRENQVIGVLSVGLKRQVLLDWQARHKGYQPPLGKPASARQQPAVPPVVWKGEDLLPPHDYDPARLFVKVNAGIGPAGSAPTARYRPMLEGFEAFNLRNGEPHGQTSFHGYLAAGELVWNAGEPRIIRAPYFRRQRRAQKIGKMVQPEGGGWAKFQRLGDYSPPASETPPGGMAECSGDGVKARRWDYRAKDWAEVPCMGDDCPFARGGTCKIRSDLLIYSDPRSCGTHALLRYENQSANSTANLEGFFTRLRKELDGFNEQSEEKLDGELYGLPIRMQVSIRVKAAGMVRGRSLPPRRFPEVSITPLANVVEHKLALRRMLVEAAAGKALAPPANLIQITAGEMAASVADFEADPPEKPREDAEVIDAEVKERPAKKKRKAADEPMGEEEVQKLEAFYQGMKEDGAKMPLLATIAQKAGLKPEIEQLTIGEGRRLLAAVKEYKP